MKTLIAFLLLLFGSQAGAQQIVHGPTRYPHVTSTLNATGLLGSDTSDVTLCTFTVPANTWLDGEEITLQVIYDYVPGDSANGLTYMRSNFTVNGASAFTFDSSRPAAVGNVPGGSASVPLTFIFIRIHDSVYFTPALWHLAAGKMSLEGKGQNGNLGEIIYTFFDFNDGNYRNGHRFTGVDFTKDVEIKWNAQWQALPNDARSVSRIISGGCEVIELN